MARRSSQVRLEALPEPPRTPPALDDPGNTISRLVPSEENACSTRDRAPSPIATVAITAATPMITPSVVNSDRALLRISARPASRKRAAESSLHRLHRGHRLQFRQGLACTGVCATSETTRPSRMTSARDAKAAMSGSWVTSTMVMPSRLSCWNSAMISRLVRVSRLPVGSSASRMRGRLTSARAMATRCCCPPDSWFGMWSSRWPRPTMVSAWVARWRRSRPGTPA